MSQSQVIACSLAEACDELQTSPSKARLGSPLAAHCGSWRSHYVTMTICRCVRHGVQEHHGMLVDALPASALGTSSQDHHPHSGHQCPLISRPSSRRLAPSEVFLNLGLSGLRYPLKESGLLYLFHPCFVRCWGVAAGSTDCTGIQVLVTAGTHKKSNYTALPAECRAVYHLVVYM